MRKAGGFETLFWGCAASVSLLAAVGARLLRGHLHLHNARVRYGVAHLPVALLWIFFFVALTGGLHYVLARRVGLEARPTIQFLGFLVAIFCLCWLPVLLAGGFVADDWLLLAAASVRKVIFAHPGSSWYALDSVDGNFRPLGTVLYFGYMLRAFGVSAQAFLAGNFLLNLLGSLVAFWIVRELGYSRIAGAAASLLYMSRGTIYTVVAWASALGDAIAILLCGVMALLILKAGKRRGVRAFTYHAGAWACFALATLGKQSAFAAPLIVALLLFLRPGAGLAVTRGRRVLTALAGLIVYSGTAAVVFFHAKTLLQTKSPYPIGFSFESLLRSFSYATWFFVMLDFPDRHPTAKLLPRFVGAAIVVGLVVLAWRLPRLLGERRRDVLFAMLAAVASLSLFVVLGTRVAAYYGSMAAFWMSIALGIAMTRFGAPLADGRARLCCFVFCVLVASGLAEIRLQQTGLLPSGGYLSGTFGMDQERGLYADMQQELALAHPEVLVLVDLPSYPSYFTAMAILADPGLRTILVYDSSAKTYSVNDLHGGRPSDGFAALNDPLAYNWVTPLDATSARRMIDGGKTLWLMFRDGNIAPSDSMWRSSADGRNDSLKAQNK